MIMTLFISFYVTSNAANKPFFCPAAFKTYLKTNTKR